MATGGSGDTLTGVIAALLGQRLAPFDAAVLGAWAHGRAGDLVAADLGQTGLTADDLPDYLPRAFRELEAGERPAWVI
jgi:NAD(P)H-hydrate epimerase